MSFVATPFVHSRPGLPSTHAVSLPLPTSGLGHPIPALLWPEPRDPVPTDGHNHRHPAFSFFPSDQVLSLRLGCCEGCTQGPCLLGHCLCSGGLLVHPRCPHRGRHVCGHWARGRRFSHQPALLCILSSHQLNLQGRKYHLE